MLAKNRSRNSSTYRKLVSVSHAKDFVITLNNDLFHLLAP